jgi:selenide, water dikinase
MLTVLAAAGVIMVERLTSLSHGAGCACKMPLALLTQLVQGLTPSDDARLLVGPELGDDAAVWDTGTEEALVATTDFFTPVVDDARDWGRIAAANAASDVFAMGGTPAFALNIVGWPKERDLGELRDALGGAAEVARLGGWIVAGGHTIDAQEPFYGQAVIGHVNRDRMLTNAGAQADQALVLTKAIGTGIIMTAAKRSPRDAVLPGGPLAEPYQAAVDSMTLLNRAAADALVNAEATAATDVTGFGLLGHLHRLCAASRITAEVEPDAVPLLPEVRELQAAGYVPGGTAANRDVVAPFLSSAPAEDVVTRLADAQTSGGLLATVDPAVADDLVAALRASGHNAAVIGRTASGEPGMIRFR